MSQLFSGKDILRNLMHFLPILHVIIKDVFYVFVFDSIHDSATTHNLCPQKFSTEPPVTTATHFF